MQISMNEEIIEQYNLLERGVKIQACRKIAKHCNRSVGTVKNHWFGTHAFPEQFQKDIIEILKDI